MKLRLTDVNPDGTPGTCPWNNKDTDLESLLEEFIHPYDDHGNGDRELDEYALVRCLAAIITRLSPTAGRIEEIISETQQGPYRKRYKIEILEY